MKPQGLETQEKKKKKKKSTSSLILPEIAKRKNIEGEKRKHLDHFSKCQCFI